MRSRINPDMPIAETRHEEDEVARRDHKREQHSDEIAMQDQPPWMDAALANLLRQKGQSAERRQMSRENSKTQHHPGRKVSPSQREQNRQRRAQHHDRFRVRRRLEERERPGN